MANGFNRVELIGNLGDEPVVRSTSSGSSVANITLAINEVRRDASTGGLINETEWVRVVAFGRTAEIMQQYLHKGSQVHIEGKLRTRSYEDKNTGEKKYSTEVVCEPNGLLMLGSRSDNAQYSSSDDYAQNSNSAFGSNSQSSQFSQNSGRGYNQNRGNYADRSSYGNDSQNYNSNANNGFNHNSYGNQNQNTYEGNATGSSQFMNSNSYNKPKGNMNQNNAFNSNDGFNNNANNAGFNNNSNNAGFNNNSGFNAAPSQFSNVNPNGSSFNQNPDNNESNINDELPF